MIDRVKAYLTGHLSGELRGHVYGTAEMAERIAQFYRQDVNSTILAALLHDIAKELPDEELLQRAERYGIPLDKVTVAMPMLLHARVGAHMAEELFGIRDLRVLEAIACHTTGAPYMGMVAQIVFVADFVEPSRRYEAATAVREEIWDGMDKAVRRISSAKLQCVLTAGEPVLLESIHHWNHLLMNRNSPESAGLLSPESLDMHESVTKLE